MKRLLFLGAGFLQDFVIRKAKEMEYNVLVLDAAPSMRRCYMKRMKGILLKN